MLLMKKYSFFFFLFFVIACEKKIEPKLVENIPAEIKENNKTIIDDIKLEEQVSISNIKKDTYSWRLNDELFTASMASKVVIIKSKRVMVLFDENEKILSRHRISLGKNNVGTKLKQGDYKTPEGIYRVIDKRSDKVYYKEILISYPNEEDKARSRSLGFSTGGGITIHAQPNWNWDGHGNDFTLSKDWTEGCIAITNEGMDNIWSMIELGTIIEIKE